MDKFSIKRKKYKNSKYKDYFDVEINDRPIGEIIIDEYLKRQVESPNIGIFRAGFTYSLLPYHLQQSEVKKAKCKHELIEKARDYTNFKNGDRINLLECDECQSIECGLFSVQMIESEKIEWSNFAYQNNNELKELNTLTDLRFSFEKEKYMKEFENLIKAISLDFQT